MVSGGTIQDLSPKRFLKLCQVLGERKLAILGARHEFFRGVAEWSGTRAWIKCDLNDTGFELPIESLGWF